MSCQVTKGHFDILDNKNSLIMYSNMEKHILLLLFVLKSGDLNWNVSVSRREVSNCSGDSSRNISLKKFRIHFLSLMGNTLQRSFKLGQTYSGIDQTFCHKKLQER